MLKITLSLVLVLLSATLSQVSCRKHSQRQDEIAKSEVFDRFVEQDEGQNMEAYLGGYNSEQAAMLQVTYKSLEQLRKKGNRRWKAEKHMVEDMQKMLLTGGVKTNIFRSRSNDASPTFVFVLNDQA
mmetsp:Transcript_39134/g.51185  ORF Transcript_39134/g.51185 Transcript_39134/m.51185 type:complete len:127 (-) Transcript_39134:381-761(-)